MPPSRIDLGQRDRLTGGSATLALLTRTPASCAMGQWDSVSGGDGSVRVPCRTGGSYAEPALRYITQSARFRPGLGCP